MLSDEFTEYHSYAKNILSMLDDDERYMLVSLGRWRFDIAG